MDTPGDCMSTARRLWLWPVAILVSLPIGGYIADLVVDGVDSVGAAGRVKLTRCTPSCMGRSFRGVPEVLQPASVRPTRSALTCQSRVATASS